MEFELPELPKGMKQVPYGFPFMMPAFLGCAGFAIGKDEIRSQFEKDTGFKFESLSRRSPIEKMVDKATGRESEMFLAFLDWVALNMWGIEGQEFDDDGNEEVASGQVERT